MPNGIPRSGFSSPRFEVNGTIEILGDKSAKIQALINLPKLGEKEIHKTGLLSTLIHCYRLYD
jgi:hypothetical protein